MRLDGMEGRDQGKDRGEGVIWCKGRGKNSWPEAPCVNRASKIRCTRTRDEQWRSRLHRKQNNVRPANVETQRQLTKNFCAAQIWMCRVTLGCRVTQGELKNYRFFSILRKTIPPVVIVSTSDNTSPKLPHYRLCGEIYSLHATTKFFHWLNYLNKLGNYVRFTF